MERRSFSVSIFACHARRVLLIRHLRLGTWLPVGGELTAGETPLEAAARELREETGLVGSFTPLPGAGTGTPAGLLGFEEHLAGSKGRHLNFCFRAEVESDRVAPNHEFAEWRWVDRPEAVACPENVRECLVTLLRPNPRTIAERWLAAFNAHDLEALVGLYADNAVHHSPKLRARQPETEGRIVGKPALRAWWGDSFARLPGLSYERIALTADGERAVLEYWRKSAGESDLRVGEAFHCVAGLVRESFVYHG